MKFESKVAGIPCIIDVTYIEPYRPAKIHGDPDSCYEAEGGNIEFDVLDRRGRPAPWLERKMTDRDEDRIYEEATA